MSFLVKFTRYKDCERRISNAQFINADSFQDAAMKADYMLAGMRGSDPEARFEVERIEDRNSAGINCEGGSFMFETKEECTDRFNEE